MNSMFRLYALPLLTTNDPDNKRFIEDDEKFDFCVGVVTDDDYEGIRTLIDNDEIDEAIERLRKLWDEHEPQSQRTSSEEVDLRVGLARIQAAWRQPFLGPNLTVLEETIKDQSNEFDGKTPPYAKVMPIVQSSGAGKSRLVDHFAAHHLGVIYTFRLKDQSGYPPGDTIITSLMRESLKKLPTTRRTMEHATAVALIGATCIEMLRIVKEAPDESLSNFPKWFRDQMAPQITGTVDENEHIVSDKEQVTTISSMISRTRSPYRIGFCNSVNITATEIINRFKNDSDWTEIFNKHDTDKTFNDDTIRDHPLIQEFLFKSVHNLLEELRRKNIGQSRDPVQFFIALDEISNLHKKDNPEPTVLVGFLRIFRLLRSIPVWTIVLSTKRPLHHVAPAVAMDLSARIKAQVYRCVPPFHAFLASLSFFDISTSMLQKERQKSVSEFSSVNHLARIGRPLWQSYLTSRPQVSVDDALSFVDLKLFCGQTFDPENDLMLVAFLSNRVALDPCLNRLESTSLEERSVSSHLRWISHVHTTTGIFRTITLEEPIVCAAAARAVCTPSATESWETIMMKVFQRLCTPGLIDRGRTGELFLRCVFINARDTMFREMRDPNSIESPKMGDHIPHCRPFKFISFIETLLAPKYAKTVLDTPASTVLVDKGLTVRTQLAKGYCNFTHWSSTNAELNKNTVTDLLHRLLYCQAALQLAPNQKVWDGLIPIYHGDLSEPLDCSKIAVLLIRVKNKVNGTDFNVANDRAIYEELFGKRMVITVLMDLGLKTVRALTAKSYRQHTWASRICGRHSNLFHSMPATLNSVIDSILQNDTALQGLQATVGEYNEQWNNHGWKQYLDTSKITKQLKSSSLAVGAPRGAKRKELQKHANKLEEDDEKEEGGPLKLMKYIDPSNSPSMETQ